MVQANGQSSRSIQLISVAIDIPPAYRGHTGGMFVFENRKFRGSRQYAVLFRTVPAVLPLNAEHFFSLLHTNSRENE